MNIWGIDKYLQKQRCFLNKLDFNYFRVQRLSLFTICRVL